MVAPGMGGDNIDEDAFKTINHFALSGNQLVAFDADPENGVPVSFQLVALRADWTNIAVGFFSSPAPSPLGTFPLPLTALWLDNHGHALTVRRKRDFVLDFPTFDIQLTTMYLPPPYLNASLVGRESLRGPQRSARELCVVSRS